MKRYRTYAPNQTYLLPPSPSEWLPEGHLAHFILELVEDLDLGDIERVIQSKDHRGERPFSPRMMTALLLYGYSVGVVSSRKLERATFEDVGFRMLSAGEHPHFTTINEFRAVHRQAFANLFQQVLEECMSAGLVKLGHVAIDGTKMKANASKHKAMSFDRMEKDDTRLKAEIEALIAHSEAVDAAEDQLHGVGQQPQDLPAELSRREDRRAKIKEVRAALKAETAKARAAELIVLAEGLRASAADPSVSATKKGAFSTIAAQHDQQAAELLLLVDENKPSSVGPLPTHQPSLVLGDPADDEHGDDDDDLPPGGLDNDLPMNTPQKTPDGTPKPKAQRNFTDPDSRIMLRDGGFLQGYNGQIAVDEAHQIIVAAALSNQAPDAEYFEPMLRRVVENCDAVPERTTADSGYFSVDNLRAAEALGTEPFIAVGGHKRNGFPDDEGRRPASFCSPEKNEMRTKLASLDGHAAYARRKATVEPVFGQIRTCQGIQKMSFRGMWKNRCEWLLICATHNLLKLWRATTRTRLQHALVA